MLKILDNLQRVLVFGAHPDDETLGMGGTIARLSQREGAEVTVVTFTRGETAYEDKSQMEEVARIREKEKKAVKEILGVKEWINLGQPCQGLVAGKEMYQEAVRLIRKYKPQAIFTHYKTDRHWDHQSAKEIVERAWYKAAEQGVLGKDSWSADYLFSYEIFELFPLPELLVDISETMSKKIEAVKAYSSQEKILSQGFKIEEYIQALGRTRGYLRKTKYAEAFKRHGMIPHWE
jgi:LmbE family N-acetylglucosaminyl deacetylase